MNLNRKILFSLLMMCYAFQYSVGQTYCDAGSLGTFPGFEIAITKVSFGAINNSSDQTAPVSGGYEDYTGLDPIADFEQGMTYPISVSVFNETGIDVYVWVFIDWNQDEEFDVSDEAISLGSIGSTGSLTANITIPVAADLGNTRMRVVLISEQTFVGPPCNNNPDFSEKFGEVEDYTINITAAPEPELFITEVSHPQDALIAKFVEVYNAGVTEVDLSVFSYYLIREANVGNANPPDPGVGSFYNSTQLLGKIGPKSYYILSKVNLTNFNNYYNTSYTSSAGRFGQQIDGDGNDTYALTTASNGSNSQAIDQDGMDNTIDIYGEFGINGFSGSDTCIQGTGSGTNCVENNDGTANDAPWEYEHCHVYRNNPDVKNPTSTWDADEWTIVRNAQLADMTPGYGNNDYIYNGTDWSTNIYLPNNPVGEEHPDKNMFIRSGSVTMDDDTTIGDLVVREGATLIITPNVKLTVTGDILNEGTIIFESDATGSAVLEAVQPNTRVVGNEFEIHRYIPPQRAFRYLSPSVTTTESINANWQEGASSVSQDPNPEYGTHITGSTTGANGFDATQTGNPSMFTWDAAEQDWEHIPNTDTDPLVLGKVYGILIRGDRSILLNANDNVGGETRLRSRGEIHVGDFEVPSSQLANTVNHYNLIGNPYQSQVDLDALLKGDTTSTGLNENIVYIYDPTINTRGAYVTVDLAENTNDIGSVPGSSDANRYLQPNQAFFVQTTAASPSLTFTEDSKNNEENQTTTFSTGTSNFSYLNINLKDDNQVLLDGVRLVFGEGFAAHIDYFDAPKFWNQDESLSIFSQDTFLAIEKRPAPVATDTTHLALYNYRKQTYQLEVEWMLAGQEDVEVFLIDEYLQTSTLIEPHQFTRYDFTVDPAIPASVSPARFYIDYQPAPLSVSGLEAMDWTVYPNPISAGQQLHISGQELAQIESASLFNLQGQRIHNWKSDQFQQSTNQSILSLPQGIQKGLYLLKLDSTKGNSTHKLIVE